MDVVVKPQIHHKALHMPIISAVVKISRGGGGGGYGGPRPPPPPPQVRLTEFPGNRFFNTNLLAQLPGQKPPSQANQK